MACNNVTNLCSRKLMAWASLLICVASFVYFFRAVEEKKVEYLLIGAALPGVISVLAVVFMKKIRKSKARYERLFYLEAGSPLLALFVTGVLACFTPISAGKRLFGHSVVLQLWGWLMEASLGLCSQIGLTNTTAALALGSLRSLHLPLGQFFLYSLLPATLLAACKAIAFYVLPRLLAPEEDVEPKEEARAVASAANLVAVENANVVANAGTFEVEKAIAEAMVAAQANLEAAVAAANSETVAVASSVTVAAANATVAAVENALSVAKAKAMDVATAMANSMAAAQAVTNLGGEHGGVEY